MKSIFLVCNLFLSVAVAYAANTQWSVVLQHAFVSSSVVGVEHNACYRLHADYPGLIISEMQLPEGVTVGGKGCGDQLPICQVDEVIDGLDCYIPLTAISDSPRVIKGQLTINGDGGLVSSSQFTTSWTSPVPVGPPVGPLYTGYQMGSNISSVVGNQQQLYAGDSQTGMLYKSVDGGQHWIIIPEDGSVASQQSGPNLAPMQLFFAGAGQENTRLYTLGWSHYYDGLLTSSDSGKTWREIAINGMIRAWLPSHGHLSLIFGDGDNSLQFADVDNLANAKPVDFFHNYLITHDLLFAQNDHDPQVYNADLASLKLKPTGQTGQLLAVDQEADLVLLFKNNNLYTWQANQSGAQPLSIGYPKGVTDMPVSAVVVNQTPYIATQYGIYRYVKGQWVSLGMQGDKQITRLKVNDDKLMVYFADGSIKTLALSDNTEPQWKDLGRQVVAGDVQRLSVSSDNTTMFALSRYYGSPAYWGAWNYAVFKSADQGKSWGMLSLPSNISSFDALTSMTSAGDVVYIAVNNHNVYRYENNVWTAEQLPLVSDEQINIMTVDANDHVIVAGNDGRVYFRDTKTWYKVEGLTDAHSIVSNSNKVCVATGKGVYVNTDGILSKWQPMSKQPLLGVEQMAMDEDSLYAIVPGKGLFYLALAGEGQWQSVDLPDGIGIGDIVTGMTMVNGDLYIAIAQKGIYYRQAGKWLVLDGDSSHKIQALLAHNGHVYAGTQQHGCVGF